MVCGTPAGPTAAEVTPMGSRYSPPAPPDMICFFGGNTGLLSDVPLLPGEPAGAAVLRTRFDLGGYIICRQQANIITPGLATCQLFIQYSTDQVTWHRLTLPVSAGSIGRKYTTWAPIPIRASGDVYLRIAGQGGDGVTDFFMSAWYLEIW